MHSRSRLIFVVLVVAQVAHSIEEYLTHLYEILAPARVISSLFSDDLAVGFVIFNSIVITIGLWCYFGPVRSGQSSAAVVAWVWAIIEFANGIGHMVLSVLARGYFSGAISGAVLLCTSVLLAFSLRADANRSNALASHVA